MSESQELAPIRRWLEQPSRPARARHLGLIGAAGLDIDAKVNALLDSMKPEDKVVLIAGADLQHSRLEIYGRVAQGWRWIGYADFEYATNKLDFGLSVVKRW